MKKKMDSLSGMLFLSVLTAAIWGGVCYPQLCGADAIAEDFPQVTLQDQDGKQFSFYEDLLRDKIVLINLMYTRCDGTLCDRGTRNLVKLQRFLGDRLGREIFIYSITLDPEHDTPNVLKAYAEQYGARWTFLTGKIDDITALRYKLGLFDPDPKVDADRTQHSGMLKIGNVPLKSWSATSVLAEPARILEMIHRTTLPTGFARQSATQKLTATKAPLKSSGITVTINGLRTPNRWEPSSPTVKVGDVVEWHAAEGRHGVIFKDFNLAKVVLEFDTEASLTIGPQPGFPDPAQGTEAKTAPPDTLLVRATVKEIPAGVTEIPFVCTQHGAPMDGKLVLQAAEKSVESVSAPAVTINGLRQPNRWDPKSVAVKAGDVVEWHATAGKHGVIFSDWNVAQLVLEVDATASLPIGPQTGFPAPAQGTVAEDAPQLLVRATVKEIPAGVTEIPFVCTEHGAPMDGTLVLQAAEKRVRSVSAPAITINGLRQPNRWDPKSVAVKAGDVVEWHATAGKHGVIFSDWNVAQLVLEVDATASLPIGPQTGFPAPAQGTVAEDAPQLLVRATVKEIPAGVTEIPFVCTQHGAPMDGKLVLQAAEKSVESVSAPAVTINGLRQPNRWDPKSVAVKAGDVVEWHATAGKHGVIFSDWNVAQLVLEVDATASLPIGPQTGFPAPAQGTVAEDAPQLLVRATVKEIPAGVTEIPFVCTEHGAPMDGTLVLQAAEKRVRSVSAPAITINGLRQPNRWDPKSVAVKAGDVVEWHATAGKHGVIFSDWNVAQLVLEVDATASLPIGPQTGFPAPAQGTVAEDAPQLLVRATVKEIPAGVTEIPFVCTEHGAPMDGTLVLQAAEKSVESVSAPAVTINGLRQPNRWDPKSVAVKAGDVVEWHATAGKHGVIFSDWNVAQLVLEVDATASLPIGPQTGFPAPAQGTVAEDAPQLLVRATVKEIPAGVTEIPFVCTEHGAPMDGTLVLQAAEKRVRSVSAPAITINGLRQPNRWDPKSVAVKAGDVVEWHATAGKHGVIFSDWNVAQLVLEVDATASLPIGPQTGFPAPAQGTVAEDAPQLLVRATVKEIPAGVTEIPFVCTQHGAPMDGKLVLQAGVASKKDGVSDTDSAMAEMSASMQRRMLRFVNSAHRPEDLMKSPQEVRAKSEHLPVDVHKKKSDAKKGFPPEMAEELIERRPLDGYRDVRECLPIYKSFGGLDEISGVLKSLGPEEFGRWAEVPGRVPSVMHAALMNNGKVLFITDTKATVVWDPAGTPVVLSEADTGLEDILYCCGQSFLSDGRLLAVGGGGSNSGAESSIHAWKFDPVTSKWSRTKSNMAFRRWYPTAVTLGDEPGRVLVAAGSMGSDPAPRMEVYSETTDAFTEITATGPDLLFEPTYPGLHLLPGGEIFHAPTGFFDCDQLPATGTTDPTAIFRFTSPTSGSWTKLGANQRLKGMSALLFETTSPFVQGLVVGGGDVSKNGTAQTIDLSTLSLAWSLEFPLLEARIHPNLVVLPDGTVFVCGGKEKSATTPPQGGRCELYNPNTGLTTEMDELIVPRHYHSVALLLPDARVMVAGGADDGGCTISTRPTIEVFSPPYLFKSSRPVISSATKFVDHGATIEIKTSAASEVQRVVLARPAAVTHQTDSEQRVIPLSFQVTGADMIEAKAPGGPGANPIAPAGHYMLFILNQLGVPSASKWIILR